MKKRHKYISIIIIVLFTPPLIFHFLWLLQPYETQSIFIMDKSAINEKYARQRTLNWILNHRKIKKNDGTLYDALNDYYGFIPLSDSQYKIKDLEGITRLELNQKVQSYDLAYYLNTYGVFAYDFYEGKNTGERLYGGLTHSDIEFIRLMLNNNKTVVTEHIFFAEPTPPGIRSAAEELFRTKWTGWTGRYFPEMDTMRNGRIPQWIVALYESTHNKTWQFKNDGIVLIHKEKGIVVLESPTLLSTPVPVIKTEKDVRKHYGIIDKVPFSSWFSIVEPDPETTETVSWFELKVTPQGEEVLKECGIPPKFPALVMGNNNVNTVYFAGDFGRADLSNRFIELKTARFSELFLTDLNDYTEKNGVFFAFYLPVMSKILKEE